MGFSGDSAKAAVAAAVSAHPYLAVGIAISVLLLLLLLLLLCLNASACVCLAVCWDDALRTATFRQRWSGWCSTEVRTRRSCLRHHNPIAPAALRHVTLPPFSSIQVCPTCRSDARQMELLSQAVCIGACRHRHSSPATDTISV